MTKVDIDQFGSFHDQPKREIRHYFDGSTARDYERAILTAEFTRRRFSGQVSALISQLRFPSVKKGSTVRHDLI
jgi:hypothetical protein